MWPLKASYDCCSCSSDEIRMSSEHINVQWLQLNYIRYQLLTLLLISSLRQKNKKGQRKWLMKYSNSVWFPWEIKGLEEPLGCNAPDTVSFFTILKILVREPFPSPALAFLALDWDFWLPCKRQRVSQWVMETFGWWLSCCMEPLYCFSVQWGEGMIKDKQKKSGENMIHKTCFSGVCSQKQYPAIRSAVQSSCSLLLQYNCVPLAGGFSSESFIWIIHERRR